LDKKISWGQFAVLTFGFTIGTSILITPSQLAFDSKQDAWLAAILGVLINLLMVWIYSAIAKKAPGKSLVEMNEIFLGKWLGKLVSALFILFFYLLTSLLIGDLGYFLTTEVMPETPIEALQLLFVVAVVISVRLGMPTMARAGLVFLPWIVFFLLVLTLSLLPQVDIRELRPVLEFGIRPVIKGAINFASLQELVIMLMFCGYVAQSHKVARGLYLGTFLGGAVLIVISLMSITILGVDLTANNAHPTYVMAKTINIGDVFQRVEALLITLWVLTIFIKTFVCFSATLTGTAQLFGLKEHRSLVYPMTIILLVLSSASYQNIVYIRNFIANIAVYSMVFLLLLPLILLIAATIRKPKLAASES